MSRQLKVQLLHDLYLKYLKLSNFYHQNYMDSLDTFKLPSTYQVHLDCFRYVLYEVRKFHYTTKEISKDKYIDKLISKSAKCDTLIEALTSIHDSLKLYLQEEYEIHMPSYFDNLIEEAHYSLKLQEDVYEYNYKLTDLKENVNQLELFKKFYDNYSDKLISLPQEDYNQCKKWLDIPCTPLSEIILPKLPTEKDMPVTFSLIDINKDKLDKLRIYYD